MKPLFAALAAFFPLALIALYYRDQGGGVEYVDTNAPAAAGVPPIEPDAWQPLPSWLTPIDPLGSAPPPDALATTGGSIVLNPGTVAPWQTPAAGLQYAAAFAAAEQKYGLPAGMLSSQAFEESRYNAKAFNKISGAIGLMQFEPATAKDYGIDPWDPLQSIDGAGRYMRDLYQRFGSWSMALAAYNWGMGNLQRKGIARAPAETKNYFAEILGRLGIT